MVTSVGTVAKRICHDSTGRVIRKIHYAVAFRNTGGHIQVSRRATLSESDLRVQMVTDYKYDEAGNLWREEERGPDGELNRILDLADASGNSIYLWRRPDGTREYEVVRENGRETAHVYFSDSGEEIVSLKGAITPKVDLTLGWGEWHEGLACGIAANRVQGPLSEISISVSVANRSASVVGVGNSQTLERLQMELTNSDGVVVSPDYEAIKVREVRFREMNPNMEETFQILEPGHATALIPIRLDERYANLTPGEYAMVLRIRAHGDLPDLVSNRIAFTVTPEAPLH
jgi:hypothetical protein